MKKDNRDCSVPYPIYPPYQGIGMPMGVPMGMPMNYQSSMTTTSGNTINNIEGQINNIEQEINNLERRISNLENMYNTTNKYSSSNYQMM